MKIALSIFRWIAIGSGLWILFYLIVAAPCPDTARGQMGGDIVAATGGGGGYEQIAITNSGDVYGLWFGGSMEVTYLGNVFSGGPIATEKMSWGEVKVKYSNRGRTTK